MLQASLFLIIYDQSFLISSFNVRLRDCAIIIRRGASKTRGGGALHKIAAKIGVAQSKITHLTEGGPYVLFEM